MYGTGLKFSDKRRTPLTEVSADRCSHCTVKFMAKHGFNHGQYVKISVRSILAEHLVLVTQSSGSRHEQAEVAAADSITAPRGTSGNIRA